MYWCQASACCPVCEFGACHLGMRLEPFVPVLGRCPSSLLRARCLWSQYEVGDFYPISEVVAFRLVLGHRNFLHVRPSVTPVHCSWYSFGYEVSAFRPVLGRRYFLSVCPGIRLLPFVWCLVGTDYLVFVPVVGRYRVVSAIDVPGSLHPALRPDIDSTVLRNVVTLFGVRSAHSAGIFH